LYTYAVTILPVSRTTPVLACIGLSFEEAIAFHKFAGMLARTHLTCQHSAVALPSNGGTVNATAVLSFLLQCCTCVAVVGACTLGITGQKKFSHHESRV
jgi:hypothetical protein